MKLLDRRFTAMLASTLVAGLCLANATAAREGEDAPAPQASTDSQDAEGTRESVEEAVQGTADDATARRREKLIQDAVEALDETRNALDALQAGDAEAALDSLALATGKLDLVVARNPELALAPVDVRLVTYDLYATVEAVEEAREEALDHLEDGRLQDARRLIENLRSDVVVEVLNVPLATYPEAIKSVAPLIDDGEVEKAKVALRQALNTLVVTRQSHPLPIIRVEHMLTRAEELATTEDRRSEQDEELERLLDGAREELELAETLGYGQEADFERFYAQLDEISGKTSGGKSGTGFFDKIRSALRSFGESREASGA